MHRIGIITAFILCILSWGCGRDEQARLRDVALFERMDSLERQCQYDEVLGIGTTLLQDMGSSNDSLRCEVLNLMGIAHFRLGNLNEAVYYQRQCYDIDRRMGDSALLSSDLNQLAAFSLQAQQYDVARDCILEAIAIEEALGRRDVQAIRYGLASEIYLKLADLPTAKDYAQRALDIERRAQRQDKVGIRLCQLAAILQAEGEDAQATAAIEEAVPLLQEAGNLNSLAIAYCQLGELALHGSLGANAAATAQAHFANAFALCATTGNRYTEKRALQGLWNSLRDSNPALGAQYLERYTTLADSLASAQTVSDINALKRQYETRELQLENERLQADNQRKTMVNIVIVAIIIIGIGLMLMLRSNRLSRQRLMRQVEHVRLNFFTNITHEFRTPLTVILGMGEELEKNDATRDAGHAIVQEGRELLDLVNQLLDISKISSAIGNAHWRHGNVVGYINMVVESLRPLAVKNNIELTYAADRNVVDMDFVPDYVCKIVRNLIANALKYTQPTGTILMMSKVENERLVLRIADNGNGIAPADLVHIFDPFYQADNSRVTIGTGVGLSLVKLMVEAMGGTIKVMSSPRVGSVFTIELPLQHKLAEEAKLIEADDMADAAEKMADELPDGPVKADDEPEAKEPSRDDDQRPIVLVVEDNANVSAYISAQLGDAYNTFSVRNGSEGLARAEAVVPDLIITDLMMPVMDGIELCRSIRANEVLSHIPIIMVTARANDSDRLKGLEAGVDAYLSKPFNANELRLRVARLIEQRRLLRDKFQRALQAGDTTEVDMTVADRDFLDRVVNTVYALMAAYKKADINTVAQAFNMGVRTFTRKLQALTGESPMMYINRIKIEKAKRLLDSEADYPLSNIAYRCGFEDPAYFSRIFKQITNTSPTTYKRRME